MEPKSPTEVARNGARPTASAAETGVRHAIRVDEPVEMRPLIRSALDVLARTLRPTAAYVHRLEPDTRTLQLVGRWNVRDSAFLQLARQAPDAATIECAAARTRAAHVVDATTAYDAPAKTAALLASQGWTSLVAAPMLAGDELVGVLTCATSGPTVTQGERACVTETATLLGHAMAVALACARARTACRQADAERRRLAAIVECCPAAVLVVEDADGRHVTANQAAGDLFGVEQGAAHGVAHYAEVLCDRDGKSLAPEAVPLARALRGEYVSGDELTVRDLDGGVTPVAVWAVPLRDASGAVAGAIVVAHDLARVSLREKRRAQWTTLVAHDLQQPVSAILLHADAIAHGAPKDASEGHARHVIQSARQLDRLIQDLVQTSAMDELGLVLNRRLCDFGALARDVVDRHAGLMRGRVVRLDVRAPLALVLADAARLEQVLTNLLSNAAKYSEPASVVVVSVEQQDDDVVVAVENQGFGMTPDEIGTLFKRFSRLPSARRSGIAGLGLGLYMCRSIVEAHGGRIWVESDPRGTTRFAFSLPAST